MKQQDSELIFNKQISKDCWQMGLVVAGGFAAAVPGQFLMLQIDTLDSALLRRPFSISGLINQNGRNAGVELIYKVVGSGTEKMSRLSPHDHVNVIGPLGQGFRVKKEMHQIYFVAGGIGIAPIRFLAFYLKGRGMAMSHCRLFLGGRTQNDLLCRQEFESLGIPVILTTDDGSSGNQCLITDPLAETMSLNLPEAVMACGPHGMLQCVADLCHQYAVPCQISMETVMACGIGACLGCAIKPADRDMPYLHVCKDGPVFESSAISF